MYHMTVYDMDGQLLYDGPINATSDDEAKKLGYAWISENGHQDKPHRIFHVTGRLVSFKPHPYRGNASSNKA
ncbi:hypothetical protein I8U24_10180 [Thermoactinomyces sp. CICC 24226]|uniref:Uncharacterized protein n=2 Tax=Thermoactinomycetaceae TaxID=186824 RepID=A0ABS0QIF0_THEVU|nr:hypothetical protein AYX07_00790 [Thermoactinomyces sp. AS95]MBA4552054.1 hypothetical protein [Thermoactinomyces vulgaris]MBH8584125.1 hypothetical protein [Thermoactinomyces sp. CICC 10735]MBH8586727.1 hypothetical protein [Thermoactinomyces sp. CICC 10520]MBH8600884.1 hypothetical protein [Thermoactinomyces sp. CICC 23799]MBI0387704.1 hypothetical protein [Thermoactinomyces sp. CICC 24227]MBI0392479.1 hypothetical protein [Thermoactinomyces sp. CICC 24226]